MSNLLQDTPLTTLYTAAEQGNREAQYQLGLKYLTGDGVPHSLIQATQWFHTAAEFGQLGLRYEQGEGVPQNLPQAWQWLTKAADGGQPDAQRKVEADRQERYKKSIQLIKQWMAEDDGYDELVWPQIRRELQKNTWGYSEDEEKEKEKEKEKEVLSETSS
jgi:TPR repeat protein